MFFLNKKTKRLFFYILITLISFYSFKIFPQSSIGLDSDWSWEDMINKAVMVNPVLIKSVGILKTEMTINDARFLVKQLVSLNSLSELNDLYRFSLNDFGDNDLKQDSLLKLPFNENFFNTEDRLEGIILSLGWLAELRKAGLKNSNFDIMARKYLQQPGEELNRSNEINFNFSGTESILDYFEGNGEILNMLAESKEYKFFTEINDPDPSSQIPEEDKLQYFLKESKTEYPLYSLYKWINPQCLWGFGGVFIYSKEYRDIIKTIKENENNIKFNIEKSVLNYLPENFILKTEINFLFGNRTEYSDANSSTVYVNLEMFGDNYDYLVRYIIHEVYKFAEKEIRLDAENLILDENMNDYISLLSDIQENGIANYAAPVGSETRPTDLLEKDFQLFNHTYNHIKNKKSRSSIDSMINAGYSGNAPFFTMATQMAYIIESTYGRNTLVETVSLGPLSFFRKFIQAYREFPDKIRRVFRFSRDVESKILNLSKSFPEKVMKDALKIRNQNYKKSEAELIVENFIKSNYKNSKPELLYFLSGKILLDAEDYEKSEYYYLKGLELIKNKGNTSGKIGKLFESKNSFKEAEKFFDIYAKESPESAKAYEMRGEFYFKNKENEKAISDFQKAEMIDPLSEITKIYLRILQ